MTTRTLTTPREAPAPAPLMVPAKDTRAATLRLDQVVTLATMQPRQSGLDKMHVRNLAQAYRNTGKLDRILVWAEQDDDGQATGRLVLLDGAHRLAAYGTVWRTPAERRQGVPAVIFMGTPMDALLRAIVSNTRERLSLSKQDRMDAAWRLVREYGRVLSKARVAGVANVSPRSVFTMRERLVELQAAGREPTGKWWKDRQDTTGEYEPEDEMTPRERKALVVAKANLVRDALGRLPHQDRSIVADIFALATDRRVMQDVMEYLFGRDDEFGHDAEDDF